MKKAGPKTVFPERRIGKTRGEGSLGAHVLRKIG